MPTLTLDKDQLRALKYAVANTLEDKEDYLRRHASEWEVPELEQSIDELQELATLIYAATREPYEQERGA